MHGIVNKYLLEMIADTLNQSELDTLLQSTKVEKGGFITSEIYPDQQTMDLVGGYAAQTGQPVEKVLQDFGRYWIVNVGKTKYGSLFDAGGADLEDFLLHLPHFHGKVLMLFEDIEPPCFEVTKTGPDRFQITYTSARSGLAPLANGMLIGLGEFFNQPVKVSLHTLSDDNRAANFTVTLLS